MILLIIFDIRLGWYEDLVEKNEVFQEDMIQLIFLETRKLNVKIRQKNGRGKMTHV